MENSQNAALASKIKTSIDEACVASKEAFRTRLGASEIGDECLRKSWMSFRWLTENTKPDLESDARQQRIFQRGNLEEARVIKMLIAAGNKVFDLDTRGPEPTQFRFSAVSGHFGGSLDGVIIPPGEEPMLLELKTASHKNWQKVRNHGVKEANPRHFHQMCLYGHAYRLKRAVYISLDKDNEDMWVEVVDLDWERAETLLRLAEIVVKSNKPIEKPYKPTAFQCKLCHHKPTCHEGQAPHKSCRSCKFGTPVDNMGWICGITGDNLEPDMKPCNLWENILNAV